MRCMTGTKRSRTCEMLPLVFFWLNVSLAAAKRLSLPSAAGPCRKVSALSRPLSFGTSAEKSGREVSGDGAEAARSASTAPASPSCGTHLGLTKLVTSTSSTHAAQSRRTSWALSAAAIMADSFCRPSRGETSVMRTLGMAKCTGVSARATR